ncbi:MAG: chromosome segregation protein SMC [Clostridia bacterium]|nr:chromosome segregation protein SMC [Clostridia bacterium]
MFLKQIEVQGFKSFPDKTVLDFERGITAIVGPNGSGKSNIVDAIRWVMGEQSTKTLRGGKMEDVIFGGTSRRSPQSFCEVSLIMDNSDGRLALDYDEVSVTRRYYRSGESEFYINRRSVRLKDIHELFMDTGLGRDGYSIIGQGRIDEILSQKSTDRREIFEEASGITKFRYRKEESERKLGACEENLVRIRDITGELETQVEPLREQSEKAKSFLIYRDELRVLEVSVWLDSLDKLGDNLHKARTDFANAERMLAAGKEEAERLQEQSERITEELHARDIESERTREEQREAEQRESELRAQIAVNETNVRNNEENIRERTRELAEQSGREDTLESQRQARLERIAELAAEEEKLRGEMEKLTQEAESSQLAAEDIGRRVDAATAAAELHKQARAEESAKKSALESALEGLGSREAGIDAERAELAARLETERGRAADIRRRIEENEELKTGAENMLAGFELRDKVRREKYESLTGEQQKARRTLDASADRLEMLQAMERDYEGFSGAVRRVMKGAERGELRGVHGPLSALVRTDDRYSVAIEIALGAALQNIVTVNEQDAKAAINYLKRNDFGRATFLSLTAVRGRSRPKADPSRDAGFVGWGDELLECEEKYRGIVSSQLSGTAVADNIDNAVAMAKRHGYAFRIVTLDGQLVNTSGAMTGGSLGKNTGILSRANEIERLKKSIAALKSELAQREERLREMKRELDGAEYEANVARDELRRAQDGLLALGAERQQHAALLETVIARDEQLEQERAGLRERRAALDAEIAAVSERIRRAEEDSARQERMLDELGADRRRLESASGELAGRTNAIVAQLAAIRGESETNRSAAAELSELIASIGSERQDKESVVAAIRARNEELRAEIVRLEAQCRECAQAAEEKSRAVRELAEKKLELEGARVKCQRDIQSKNSELINLERERGRLENKKTQAEMEEDNIIQRLWDSYELTRTSAEEVRTALESVSKAQRRIGELKSSIKKLGDVNVGAIEEYEKVRERYEFLSSQRDDLEKAKADLLEVIAELTRNMRTIFGEQFARINEAFQQTFVEIFGGGRAYLQLEDEQDILNCGIEIKVELPGKSMRAISLLSGGEKAFVAIALYFAIIKVRPTPFCIMDEIEAALDDVNILRFAEYMRTLCGSTQFIVITHRRGTMEGADILYGVTMQEQGVTKLLRLNVAEAEKQLGVKLR